MWHRVCARSEVSEERPYGAEVDGRPIGVFVEDGACYALEDVCPHAFAPLSTGWVAEGAVECPLHNARFNLKTGQCVSTPAYETVPVYEVRVEGNDVLVKVE